MRAGSRPRTTAARSTTRSRKPARNRRSGAASRSRLRARSRHSVVARLSRLVRNLMQRDRVERDLDDEVRAAFELLVDEKLNAGANLEAARRAATLEMGRVDVVK